MTALDDTAYAGESPRPMTITAALERARKAEEAAAKLAEEVAELRATKDGAYTERNHLVALLARLFPSGIRPTNIEGWDPEWQGCVYIDMPDGKQISYHYHDNQAHLFKDLPPYTKEYDGHQKDDVHELLQKAWKYNRLIPADWLKDWIENYRKGRCITIDLNLAKDSSPEFERAVNEARRITSHSAQLLVLEKLENEYLRYLISKARGCKPEDV